MRAGAEGLTFTGTNLLNQQGLFYANGGAVLLDVGSGNVFNQGGTLQGDSLNITAGQLNNSASNGVAGILVSQTGALDAHVGQLINQGGQIASAGAVNLAGTRVDNSNGQLSGNDLTFNLSGGLTNQTGLIESANGLSLVAASVNNSAGGQLRALQGSNSVITVAGDFNNRSGSLAVGSTDLSVNAAQFDNTSGEIQHAGTGTLTLNLTSFQGNQGSVTSLGQGVFSIANSTGTGAWQTNGDLAYFGNGTLLLNSGDRVASATGLSFIGGSLNSAGQLLSDGNLTTQLSGDLTNSGLVSAHNTLAVTAANLIQNAGQMVSGAATTLNLSGTLDNGGELVSAQALTVNAATINNRGTLGSQSTVSLNASDSIANNADSLIYSGSDLTLRANQLTNTYGDLYSAGNLSFAALGDGPAASFANLSGSVQSQGDLSLYAGDVTNAKAVFSLAQVITDAYLEWHCGQHCSGDWSFKRGQIYIDKTFTDTITADSPAARLVAGHDLAINANSVTNNYSLMAADNDLTITANSLLNQGATGSTAVESIVIGTPGRISNDYWDQMQYVDVPAFNNAVAAGNLDVNRLNELAARSTGTDYELESDNTVVTNSNTPLAAATLQAGGNVNLNVATTAKRHR